MKNNVKKNNFLKDLKSFVTSKQFFMFCIFAFVMCNSVFAQSTETITTLDDWGQKILNLFTGTWVKALLMVALIVEAIALIFAGQQGGGPQMLKKFAPWIIGTIVLLSASSIASYFLKDLTFDIDF